MSIGKPLPHDSAPLHVTGAARYVDDIPLPADALHLAFGLSHRRAWRDHRSGPFGGAGCSGGDCGFFSRRLPRDARLQPFRA